VMFEAIDTNKDKRIEASEFVAAAKLVETWGMKIEDPAVVFGEIDVDGGGMILFDEFADWAIRRQLDLPDVDKVEKGGAGTGVSRTGPQIAVRGVSKTGAAAKPATKPGSPAAKTPAKPATAAKSTTPSPRPAPAPVKPKTPAAAPATPAKPAETKPASPTQRAKSPAARAADAPKPAWGSAKAGEKKAAPAPAGKPSPGGAKTEQKVSLGIKFDAAEGGGVTVTSVNPDSTSQKAGIQVGDILKTMAGKAIGTKEEFKAILVTLEVGLSVDVTAKRGAEDITLKIQF